MKIPLGRLVLTAFGVELLSILALVAIVAVFGPPDAAAAKLFAERVGAWFGPLSGVALCLGAGFLVARRPGVPPVATGLCLGAFVAAIDLALLVLGGASFQLIFVFSNLGRVLAGTLGGWLARRSSPTD